MPVAVCEKVMPDSVGVSVGNGMVELSPSVAEAMAVGSDVAISVGLETGMSVMVVPGSVVTVGISEVTGSKVGWLVLETSGVLPGGVTVGETSVAESKESW